MRKRRENGEEPGAVLEKILTAKPINATAAKVTAKGFEYNPQKAVVNLDSDLPIPYRRPTQLERAGASFQDLSDARFARFLVLGVFVGGSTKRGMRWVCRCVCGRYTVRVTKSLKNPLNNQDACEICRHTTFLKKKGSQQNSRDRARSEGGAWPSL